MKRTLGIALLALLPLACNRGATPVVVTGPASPPSWEVRYNAAAALAREHPQVVPGYHLNKRHWITIGLGGAPGAPEALPAGLVEECVDESYDLVVAGLPARLRPSRDD